MTIQGFARTEQLLLKAFPAFSREQLQVLKDRMFANGFSDQRAYDAVCHVIDTYQGYGKIPNIADFIQFDRKFRVYTYNQVCDQNLWDETEAIDVGLSKPRWALSADVLRFRLKRWEVKP